MVMESFGYNSLEINDVLIETNLDPTLNLLVLVFWKVNVVVDPVPIETGDLSVVIPKKRLEEIPTPNVSPSPTVIFGSK